MGDLLVVEACLVENFNDKWSIDSGATNHVCYSLQWFKHSTSIEEGQRYLKLENGELIFVKAICKTRENSNFRKKGKIVILLKIQNFSRSWMMKWISPLESSCEI